MIKEHRLISFVFFLILPHCAISFIFPGNFGQIYSNLRFQSTTSISMIENDETERMPLFDAHCHIQLSKNNDNINFAIKNHRVALMGTKPDDWDDVIRICDRHPQRAVACLGLHPWHAHAPGDPDWLARLRRELERRPAAGVGEIGLDRQWVPPGRPGVEYEAQVAAFKAQLALAAELARPVSLHCVHAQGDMLELLRGADRLPPAVYFHSFGGKAAMADSFVKMRRHGPRFYFGFSAFANGRSHRTPEVIQRIPRDRLLLESDLEEPLDAPADLRRMLHTIADVDVGDKDTGEAGPWAADSRGWSLEEAAAVTADNARRLYGLPPLPEDEAATAKLAAAIAGAAVAAVASSSGPAVAATKGAAVGTATTGDKAAAADAAREADGLPR